MRTEVSQAPLQRQLGFGQKAAGDRLSAGHSPWARGRIAALLFLTSLVAISITGYHPYGEDAGIYVAGIKLAAHPGLYGSSAAFIAPYFRLSLFAECNAWLLRSLHVPLEYLLFAMQILTTWLLLSACWGLAKRCFQRSEERWAAVMLIAVCLSVPVAGSSLFMMDPYLTGRSYSTPLALLAICACLDEEAARAGLLLLLVGLFHPLMAIYATGFVLLLWAVKRESWSGVAWLVGAAIAAGIAVQYSQRTVLESAAYRIAAVSRTYYFLDFWRWYELAGLAAPLALLVLYCIWKRQEVPDQSVALAKAGAVAGVTSIATCLLFAQPQSHSHLISALQTIRPFLWIYFCMFLLIGGVLGRYWLKRIPWRWALLFLGTAAGLAFSQHLVYPASAQIQLPGTVSHNGWDRAFVWIRENTPADAVVALDADYIHAPGEDAQGFRAIAERSSLADSSKDGGAAAAFPHLAERWMREQTATTGLNRVGDLERLRRLAPFHVSWIVLDKNSATAMICPFEDDLVKVCRLQ